MEFRHKAILAGIGGAVCVAATSALAQSGNVPDRNTYLDHGHGMMWGAGQWGGWGMVLWPALMVLFGAGMIYLLLSFGTIRRSVSSHGVQDRALVLLRERYAKGEIDSDAFTAGKKLLAE